MDTPKSTELRTQLDAVMNEFNALIDSIPHIKELVHRAAETDSLDDWQAYTTAVLNDAALMALLNRAKELSSLIAIEENPS